jgi:lysozyme family protein
MQHPYTQLQPEYAGDIAHLVITRPLDIDNAAKKILQPQNIDRYIAACQGTEVPPAFVGALDIREDDCNPRLGLGQGDPWNQVSTHVPRGFGPFPSWATAAHFYIHYDHLDDNSSPWSIEYACFKGEVWNGFGPRAHGRATGYLWSGTSIYTGGKYVADGVWSSTTKDVQLGIIPIILRIGQLRPDLAIGSSLPNVPAPPVAPAVQTSPVGVGGGTHPTWWVQTALNALGALPLLTVDNSYGEQTRKAVRAFQTAHGLHLDGLVGDETFGGLEKALATAGISDASWEAPGAEAAA